MARDFVCLYHSYLDAMEALGDAERGRLVTAMINYSQRREIGELSGNERYIWPMIRSQIDRDMEAYERKCETNRTSGGKRTQANASERQRTLANAYKEKGKGEEEGDYSPPESPPEGKKRKRERKVFVKPTVEEIAAYCAKRNNGIDAQYFFDKQESAGWVVGKGKPMQDWKATIRTWEYNERNGYGSTRKTEADPYADYPTF